MPGRHAARQSLKKSKLSYNETNRRKPIITCWLGEAAAKEPRDLFAAADIPTFSSTSEAVTGFMQLVRYARAQAELMQTPPVAAGKRIYDTEDANRKSFGYCNPAER